MVYRLLGGTRSQARDWLHLGLSFHSTTPISPHSAPLGRRSQPGRYQVLVSQVYHPDQLCGFGLQGNKPLQGSRREEAPARGGRHWSGRAQGEGREERLGKLCRAHAKKSCHACPIVDIKSRRNCKHSVIRPASMTEPHAKSNPTPLPRNGAEGRLFRASRARASSCTTCCSKPRP